MLLFQSSSIEDRLDLRQELLPMLDQLGLAVHQRLQVGDDGSPEVLGPVPLEQVDLSADDAGDAVKVGLALFQFGLPLPELLSDSGDLAWQ